MGSCPRGTQERVEVQYILCGVVLDQTCCAGALVHLLGYLFLGTDFHLICVLLDYPDLRVPLATIRRPSLPAHGGAKRSDHCDRAVPCNLL